jgi:hypothetical protein
MTVERAVCEAANARACFLQQWNFETHVEDGMSAFIGLRIVLV